MAQTSTCDPSYRFETSWILSPWALCGVRAIISLYAFTTTFFIIGWQLAGRDGLSYHDTNKSFSFFTVLCYWGICFYFLAAAITTATYALHGRPPLRTRLPRLAQALHSLSYTTITNFPFLVTIVYWAILYSPAHPFEHRFQVWSNVSQHGLNSAFALIEILLPRTAPPPWIHLPCLLALLTAYLALAYITYATKHYFVYGFLDWHPRVVVDGENVGGVGPGGVVGHIFGIMAAACVFFCLSRSLVALRMWLTETRLGLRGKFYAGREMEGETSRNPAAEKI